MESGEVIAPAAASPEITRRDHFARFYIDDKTLLESVAEYVRRGLREGAAIVIATERHLASLEDRLAREPLDIAACRSTGQLVLLDAANTLKQFMQGDRPDRARFLASVGEVVATATRRFDRAIAFGEMVSLLWKANHAAAAVELEALWNELRQKYEFSLYCGYSLPDCAVDPDDAAFQAVCNAHRFVIPAESFPTSTVREQCQAILELQRKALVLETTLERDRELRAAAARMAAIVESSDDAIVSKNLDGIIQTWNKGAQRIFGYSAEEAIGRSITLIIPPDRLDEEQRILATLRRGERLDHFETQRLTKNGDRVEISLSVSPIRGADGSVIGASKIARDITARNRAEQLLQERERDLRAANVKLQEGMLRVRESEQRLASEAEALRKLNDWSSRLWSSRDLQQGIEAMLDGVIELLGADKGTVQLLNGNGIMTLEAQRGFDRELLDFFREVSDQDESPCGRALRSGQLVLIEDVEADEAYATMRQIGRSAGYRAVISVPLVSAEGAPQGILSAHFVRVHRPTEHDLTRLALYARHGSDFVIRCKVEQALREADRRKDEYLALLAHELRNPLAPIRYALAANSKGQRTIEQRRATDELIERQVTHMSRLLDDLLDVARITRGKLELKKVPAELTSVLAAAIETARPLLDSKHQTLSLDFPKEAIRFEVDAVRLAQVFSNLLINAAKYTDPNGRIQLSAARENGEVVVRVRDNGIGISEEMMPRLFEMFSQADTCWSAPRGDWAWV